MLGRDEGFCHFEKLGESRSWQRRKSSDERTTGKKSFWNNFTPASPLHGPGQRRRESLLGWDSPTASEETENSLPFRIRKKIDENQIQLILSLF